MCLHPAHATTEERTYTELKSARACVYRYIKLRRCRRRWSRRRQTTTHREIANGILWSGMLSNFVVPPDKSPLIRNPLNWPR